MPRFDKFDSESGGFRTVLAANLTGDSDVYGVGLDVNGRWVKGEGQTGIIGVSINPTRPGHSFLAKDAVDVMRIGEIVEFDGDPATIYYADPTTGVVSDTPSQYPVGFTVEASRLIVSVTGGVGTDTVTGGQTNITSLTLTATDIASKTAADLLVDVDSTSLATVKSTADQNFKDIGTKINAILAALDASGVTV
jgi:hypothetical protein